MRSSQRSMPSAAAISRARCGFLSSTATAAASSGQNPPAPRRKALRTARPSRIAASHRPRALYHGAGPLAEVAMADLVNLNRYRKQRARDADRKTAAKNRARFGRTKSDRAKETPRSRKSRQGPRRQAAGLGYAASGNSCLVKRQRLVIETARRPRARSPARSARKRRVSATAIAGRARSRGKP